MVPLPLLTEFVDFKRSLRYNKIYRAFCDQRRVDQDDDNNKKNPANDEKHQHDQKKQYKIQIHH